MISGRRAPVELARRLRHHVPRPVKTALRRLAEPGLGRALRRMAGRKPPGLGTISVIIPAYNVERYLENCLRSVMGQSYPHLQIIVVIDGSPDSSEAVARRVARWDRRVKVVVQDNAGLGSARNTGIRLATGDYLAFVDSDDDLPNQAYERMIAMLDRSGSDFVVGSLWRHEDGRRWQPNWAQDVHAHERIGITLEQYPEILPNVFAWNKLFRREFFDRVVQTFPEGIRYEDQEPTARAYANAAAFDVMAEPVYTWYVRSDGTSITQQKAELANLQDRLEVKRRVQDILVRDASPDVVRRWRAKAVGFDLRSYYEQVPRTDLAFWDVLRTGLAEIARLVPDADWAWIPLHDRLLARLTLADRREDLIAVQTRRHEIGDAYRVTVEGEHLMAELSCLADIDLAQRPLDRVLSAEELRLQSGLTGFHVVDDTHCEFRGFVYLKGLPTSDGEVRLRWDRVVLPEDDARSCQQQPARLDQPFRAISDPTVDDLMPHAATTHSDSAFTARVDTDNLGCGSRSCRRRHAWRLTAVLAVAGRQFTAPLRRVDHRGSAGSLRAVVDDTGLVTRPTFRTGHGLVLRQHRQQFVAQKVDQHGSSLRLRVRDLAGESPQVMSVTCRALGRELRVPMTPGSDGTSDGVVTLPALPSGWSPTAGARWLVRVQNTTGQWRPVPWPLSAGSHLVHPAERDVRPVLTHAGNVGFVQQPVSAGIVGVHVDLAADRIEVSGWARIPDDRPLRPALCTNGLAEIWLPEQVSYDRPTGRFTANFSLREHVWGAEVMRRPGGRSFRLLEAEADGARPRWVTVAAQTIDTFPLTNRGPRVNARLGATRRARALWIAVGPPTASEDSGRARQFRLHQQIPEFRRAPLREAALFSSFGARATNDSPRAVFAELMARGWPGEMYWAVTDLSVPVPPGAQPVVLHSRRYFELLHSARWLVNNSNFPFYFDKRPGQCYLQTWHGTPLKRIGRDVPAANLSLSYRRLMDREAGQWDWLLAQNAFSADVLPPAFGYPGPVLLEGYPRNDLLSTGDAERLASIRRRLGIDGSSLVVLYAPTFRDDAKSGGRYRMVNNLALGRVPEELGQTAVVLVRGHSNTPGLGRAVLPAGVRDVSNYPDVTELMLVADVLVTDYSSIMFDFAGTARPIVLLAPDLEQYRSTTRGFYFDLEAESPGPIVQTSAEAFAALRELGQVAARYEARLHAFRSRYASLDDGKSSARVVDAVWGDEAR